MRDINTVLITLHQFLCNVCISAVTSYITIMTVYSASICFVYMLRCTHYCNITYLHCCQLVSQEGVPPTHDLHKGVSSAGASGARPPFTKFVSVYFGIFSLHNTHKLNCNQHTLLQCVFYNLLSLHKYNVCEWT